MNTIVSTAKAIVSAVIGSTPVTVINFTGRDISFSGTVLPSEGHKPLFLQVTKTNSRTTKSGVQVFDAVYSLPSNFNDLVGDASSILVPSLTAFSLGPKIVVNGRYIQVYFPNTNPGYIGRDEKGAIDFNTHTTVQQAKSSKISYNSYKDSGVAFPEVINQIFVYLPHPVKIVDKAGTVLQTIEKFGDDGRSTFTAESDNTIQTTNGPLKVVTGTNTVPTFTVPASDTHDGVVISANLYAILKDNGVIGNQENMVKTFGRDNFSLLVVDNDTMVREGPKIIGAQNLLCLDIVS